MERKISSVQSPPPAVAISRVASASKILGSYTLAKNNKQSRGRPRRKESM